MMSCKVAVEHVIIVTDCGREYAATFVFVL